MHYRFFRVPAAGGPEEEGLNRFLAGVRVLKVERQFVADGQASFWGLCVEYLPSPKAAARQGPAARTDYRQVLSPPDFAVFARLREVRKAIAERAAVPVFAVFSNEQLAEMARQRPATAAALRKIDGIGQAKTAKYGEEMLAALAAAEGGSGHETGGEPVLADR